MEEKVIKITCQGADRLPIESLVAFQGNLKSLSEKEYKKLRASIEKHGFSFPVFVWRNNGSNYIIDGHQRLFTAKKMVAEGWSMGHVPVDWIEANTKKQAKEKILLAMSQYGKYDNDSLYEFINTEDLDFPDLKLEIDLPMINLDKFEQGYFGEKPQDAEPQIDRAEELNKKWQVKTGDLWQIGEHRLLCGDSTKEEDVERAMDGDKAICVFTDPPYGVSIAKKNVMLNTFQPSGRCLTDLEMDDMPPAELGGMLLKAFKICKTIMSDQCAVFVCSPQGGGLGMMMMMQEAGLEVRHILNWVKNSPTFSMGRLDYDYQHEPILFTWVKTHKRNKAGAFQTSLWTVDKPRANKEHPTEKPIELPTCAFLNHTDSGDIVVDIFGGSGTSMVAAENTKRKCRMLEIAPAYCAVILQRMEDGFPGIEIKRI